MADELQIRIVSTFDPSGVEAATARMKDLAEQVASAQVTVTDATKSLTEALKQEEVVLKNTSEGSVASIAASNSVIQAKQAEARAIENLNNLKEEQVGSVSVATGAGTIEELQAENSLIDEQTVAYAKQLAIIEDIKAAKQKLILGDIEQKTTAAGTQGAKEEVITSDNPKASNQATQIAASSASQEEERSSEEAIVAAQVESAQSAKDLQAAKEELILSDTQEAATAEGLAAARNEEIISDNEAASTIAGLSAAKEELIASDNALAGAQAALNDSYVESNQELIQEQELLDQSVAAYQARASTLAGIAALQDEVITSDNALAASIAAVTAELEDEDAAQTLAATSTIANATAMQTAASSAAQYAVSLGPGVIVTQELANAVEELVAITSQIGFSENDAAAAIENVQTVANGLGLTLKETASGYQLVQQTASGAYIAIAGTGNAAASSTVKLTQLQGAMANLSARTAALDVGLGQLGFAVGGLGRAIPSLGVALTYAFPIFGVVLLADVISAAIEKVTKLEESVRKTEFQFQSLGFEAVSLSNGIELTNLKLEDSIAKLEGRAEPNGLAIGALEARIEVDKLIDSFDRLLQKQQETATSGEISWLSYAHIVGQVEPTTNEERLIEPFRTALQQKLALQRIANDTGTEEDKKHAAEEVETARQAAEEEASLIVKNIQKHQEVLDEYANTHVTFAAEDDLGPVLAKAKSELAEFQALKPGEQGASNLPNLLEKQLQDTIANEARQRKYESDLEQIKDQETTGQRLVAIEKQTAESVFKAAQVGIKQLNSQAEEGGELRAKAELSTLPILVAAQEKINEAKLAEFNQSIQNQRDYLVAKAALDKVESKPADRERLVADDNAKLALLKQTSEDEIKNIIRDGHDAIITIESDEGEKRLEIARSNAEKIAKAYREAEKLTLQTGNFELKGINESIRSEEKLYSLGEVTRNSEKQFLAEKLSLLHQQEIAAENAIKAEISKEQEQLKPGGAFQVPELTINSQELEINSIALNKNTDAITIKSSSQSTGTAISSSSPLWSLFSTTDKLADAITKYEAGGPATRNNNPGNLKYAGQPGATPEPNTGFAQFASLDAGREALINQLELDKARLPHATPEQYFEKYSPNSAPGNGPGTSENYSSFIRTQADAITNAVADPVKTIVNAIASSGLAPITRSNLAVTSVEAQPTTSPEVSNTVTSSSSTTTSDNTSSQAQSAIQRIQQLEEQLSATTERWKAAIDQVTAAYEKLDNSTETWLLKTQVETQNEADNFLNTWQTQLTTLNNGFASAFDGYLAHGKSFGIAIANVGVKMLEDFSNDLIKIGLQFAETFSVTQIRKLIFGLQGNLFSGGSVGGVQNLALGTPSAIPQTAAQVAASSTAAAPAIGVSPSIASAATGGPASAATQASNTSALQLSTATLTSFNTALQTSVGAMATHTGTVTTATGAQAAQIPAVTANTVSHATNTGAVTTSTVAHTANSQSVFASTVAHIHHAAAVIGSTLAHILHIPIVHSSTVAHAANTVSATANTIATSANTVATSADTGATYADVAAKVVLVAGGGLIQGQGSATSDSIPAMLSHGEFVVNAGTVSQPGVLDLLHKLNKGEAKLKTSNKFTDGGLAMHFAEGGLVGKSAGFLGVPRFAAGGQVTLPDNKINSATGITPAASLGNLTQSTNLESKNTANTSNLTTNNNRFSFNQTINGAGMSPDEIGEHAFKYIQQKLRMSGLNV